MATQRFKLAVNNASFPFLYSRAGRAVAQPGFDVAPRTSVSFVGGPESLDYNVAQLLYAENVLPLATGLGSIALQDALAPHDPPVTDFDQLITLRDSVERNFLFCPARGKNYVWDVLNSVWTSHDSFAWGSTRSLVTRAYVNGRTFIFYEGARLIEWDPVLSQFNTISLTLPAGYSIGQIRGCAGASNYLVLFTDSEILWCSSLDITDFADTEIGKAGKQTPIDLRGQITCAVPISGGLIVYTNRNAVAAFFTNNPDTPFSFREVLNSGGVASYEQVTSDANQAEHYSYGSSGIQVLNLQQATSIHPDCSDFLAEKSYETWNPATKTVDSQALIGVLDVKLQYLGNRFLVLSYGKLEGQFTYALFFDSVLRRWGKIRCDHVDVSVLPTSVASSLYLRIFELTAPIQAYNVAIQDLVSRYAAVLPPKAGFVFLQETGNVKQVLTDTAALTGSGVAVFGRVQIARSKTVTFQSITLDGVYSTPAPEVSVLASSPGNGHLRDTVYTPTAGSLFPSQVKYSGRVTCENFDVAVEGRFNITTALVETTVHGSR